MTRFMVVVMLVGLGCLCAPKAALVCEAPDPSFVIPDQRDLAGLKAAKAQAAERKAVAATVDAAKKERAATNAASQKQVASELKADKIQAAGEKENVTKATVGEKDIPAAAAMLKSVLEQK